MKRLWAILLTTVMVISGSTSVFASDLETKVQELENKVVELEEKVDYFESILEKLGLLEAVEESVETESVDSAANIAEMTMGQKNALQSAQQYLSFMAFSYDGLIDQLKYDGYSDEEAAFAADNCGADWEEQAVKSAEQYLDLMSFSRDGLIGQLEFDGYTSEQASHAADAVGY